MISSKIESIDFVSEMPFIGEIGVVLFIQDYHLSKMRSSPSFKGGDCVEQNRLNDIHELKKLKNCKVTAFGK
ncbi:hypothetical protein [Pedobacter steynii]